MQARGRQDHARKWPLTLYCLYLATTQRLFDSRHEVEYTDLSSALVQVPGGVGPMTIAMLLRNTLNGAARQMKA